MGPLKTRTLAEIYLKQGHLQEACDILQALAEKDPFDQEVREKLKDLRERLGKMQSLAKWLANIQTRRKR